MMPKRKEKLLDRCTNFFGFLAPELKARIAAYLENPTEEAWEDVHCIIICDRRMGFTLWQAWLAIDPSAPRKKGCEEPWPRYPDSFTLRRAIKAALKA